MYIRQRNDPCKVNDFKYVIIDTDCGGDDAQALILLDYFVKKQGKTLLGIACSDGNAFVADVVKNVLIVQAICGSNYPVYRGNDSSIAGETLKDYFFGKDGLGETQKHFLDKVKVNEGLVQKEKAYRFIAESAIKYKGEIAFICIGPLTNLALAYHYNNSIAGCFSNISMMGCSDTLAGLHSFYTAEFNVGLDPEAAFVVFEKFKNILVCSLDTTVFDIPTEEAERVFLSDKTPKADFVRKVYAYQYNKPVTPQVCDPLAVLALFHPESIESGINLRMNIQIKGHRTRGCSVIDYFSPLSHHHNCYLIKKFDVEKMIHEIEKSYE